MNYKMSNTEKEIVDFLWAKNGPVKTNDIMIYFASKNWKRQTLNTLLIRLEEKGIIDRSIRGHITVKHTAEEMKQMECKDFIKKCGGLYNFFVSYYAGQRIPKEEAEELVKLIESLKE